MIVIKWVFTAFLIFIFVAYWFYERITLNVKRYSVYIKDLPSTFEGFTILHLSDLHSKRFGNKQSKLIDEINHQKYDLVALTGDFVGEFSNDFLPAIELFKGLQGVPIYFVSGNHEGKPRDKFKQILLDLGIDVLDNRSKKIINDKQWIWLLGVDDPHFKKDDLNMAVKGTDSAPKILLAHSPNIYPKAINHGIDLVLTGHTHGGQVRFPFIGALIAPGQGFFPKWDYGIYKEKATTMLINPGLGESDLPIRLNIKPEIGLVTLYRAIEK